MNKKILLIPILLAIFSTTGIAQNVNVAVVKGELTKSDVADVQTVNVEDYAVITTRCYTALTKTHKVIVGTKTYYEGTPEPVVYTYSNNFYTFSMPYGVEYSAGFWGCQKDWLGTSVSTVNPLTTDEGITGVWSSRNLQFNNCPNPVPVIATGTSDNGLSQTVMLTDLFGSRDIWVAFGFTP